MRPGPEGWYHDPIGRLEFRYWDGTQWTPRVATFGREAIDQMSIPTHEPPHWQGRVAPPVVTVRPHGVAATGGDSALSEGFEPPSF
jgi:hypothetical protein